MAALTPSLTWGQLWLPLQTGGGETLRFGTDPLSQLYHIWSCPSMCPPSPVASEVDILVASGWTLAAVSPSLAQLMTGEYTRKSLRGLPLPPPPPRPAPHSLIPQLSPHFPAPGAETPNPSFQEMDSEALTARNHV